MFNIVDVLIALCIVPAVKAGCGVPPTVPHSINNASSTTYHFQPHHVIVYSCEDLYLPSGNPAFVCRDGAWANPGRNFQCRPRECQFIEVQHGRVVVESYTVGSIARVTCDPGYGLQGSSVLICQSDSSWSEPPTCDVVYCEELPEVNHLIRFQANENGEFNDYTSVVTSRCADGYRIVGDSVSVCQEDGTWSGEPAYCERIHCSIPYVGGGSVSVLTDTNYGGIAQIQCDAGFQLVGEDIAYCSEDGWVGGYCYGNCTVGHISNGYSNTPILREGQRLFWECNSNFVHYPGNGESECHNGSLIPQPECRQIQYRPAGCPQESWGVKVTRRGSMCYIIIDSKMQYGAAQAECRNSYGGRLLTITNSTMMDYIASVLDNQGWATDCSCFGCCITPFSSARKVWIGLYWSDAWRWPALAGVTPTYSRWKSGEGDTWWFGRKYEKCATLHGGYTWQWDDVDCDDSYNVVCETYAVE